MATAVTCTVIVTAPPLGIVTEPWIVVPLMVKLAVAAPPLTVLPKLVALANWLGKVSTKLAPVSSVEGPALLITKLKVVVAPVATVLVLLSLLTDRLTVGMTEMAAVAVKELEPADVVNEPEGMVLVSVPLIELVTTAEIVHVEAWGIRVPEGRDNDPAPATADAAPAVQPVVVTLEGLALTRPAG